MPVLTILIGDTATIPARTIDAPMLHAKQQWARDHNLPDSINNELRIGEPAKIVRAYARNERGWEDVVEVDFDADEVRVTGLTRGLAQVDVIDEVSEPGGTLGIAGGYDILVQDEIDAAAVAAAVQQHEAAQEPAAEESAPEESARRVPRNTRR